MVNNSQENRNFPRFTTECPVFYLSDEANGWQVGVMTNMSATGMKITCKEAVPENARMQIKLTPRGNTTVPAIRGEGIVVRSEKGDARRYQIACKMIKVEPPERPRRPL